MNETSSNTWQTIGAALIVGSGSLGTVRESLHALIAAGYSGPRFALV